MINSVERMAEAIVEQPFLTEINNFLIDNKENLLDEHLKEILECHSKLCKYVNVSLIENKYGNHYSNCCWSSNSCQDGVDTCACYMVANIIGRTKKLMLLYNKLNKKR